MQASKQCDILYTLCNSSSITKCFFTIFSGAFLADPVRSIQNCIARDALLGSGLETVEQIRVAGSRRQNVKSELPDFSYL